MIGNSIATATSGLNAASLRLNVSAQNVANQSSTGSRVDGERSSAPYPAQQVQQTALPSGGVQASIQPKDPATVRYFAPEHPDADAQGFTEYPNVNMAEEVVQQQLASYDFQASLKVLSAADEMSERLVNLTA